MTHLAGGLFIAVAAGIGADDIGDFLFRLAIAFAGGYMLAS